jgi:hypothetical protein
LVNTKAQKPVEEIDGKMDGWMNNEQRKRNQYVWIMVKLTCANIFIFNEWRIHSKEDSKEDIKIHAFNSFFSYSCPYVIEFTRIDKKNAARCQTTKWHAIMTWIQ